MLLPLRANIKCDSFFFQKRRMVGEFCLSQSRVSHIVFAVDVFTICRLMYQKLLIDHGVSALDIRKCLFDVNTEGVRMNLFSHGKRHDLAIHP